MAIGWTVILLLAVVSGAEVRYVDLALIALFALQDYWMHNITEAVRAFADVCGAFSQFITGMYGGGDDEDDGEDLQDDDDDESCEIDEGCDHGG